MAAKCNLNPTIGGFKGRAYVCVAGKVRRLRRSELLKGELRDGTPIGADAVIAFGVTGVFDPGMLADPSSVPAGILLANGELARTLVRRRSAPEDLWSRGRRSVGVAVDPEVAATMDVAVRERRSSALHKTANGWLAAYRNSDAVVHAGVAFSETVHEQWYKRRKPVENEPCLKDDGQGGWVDVANVPYAKLPDGWRGEVHVSARDALEAWGETGDVEAAAEAIHVRRYERNRSSAGAEQLTPYGELPDHEKEEYRALARLARQYADSANPEEVVAAESHEQWRAGRRREGFVVPYVLAGPSGPVDIANDRDTASIAQWTALLEERRAAARIREYSEETVAETAARLHTLLERAASAGVDLSKTFSAAAAAADTAGSLEDWCLRGAQVHAADAVIVRNRGEGDEVLMITRKAPPFAAAVALPGGMVDPGENFEQAAAREMLEEVGLGVDATLESRPLGESRSVNWDPRSMSAHVGGMFYRVPADVDPTAGDDAAAVEWVSVAALASGVSPMAFGHAEWLARAYENDPVLGPRFALLSEAVRLRNTMLMREVNIERVARGAKRIPLDQANRNP